MTLLGEHAEFEMGQAPPGVACNTNGIGTVFVKAGEFGEPYPVQREWTTKPLKYGRNGDVFVCVVGATAGKLNLGIDCAIGRSVAAIRPAPTLDTKFLYYRLQPWVLKLRAASAGSAQGVISKKQLAEIPLRVPPLGEQHKIVSEIEQQFSRLDEAVTNLQRVKANFKRYRVSVLKSAVEGRLVVTEDQLSRSVGRGYEAGEVFLRRVLAQRATNWVGPGRYREPASPNVAGLPELPTGWTYGSIDQLAYIDVGFAFQSAAFVGEGVRLLRGENIEPGALRWAVTRYWPENRLNEFEHLLVDEGEIILAMDRPLVSAGLKLARVKKSDLPCLLVQRVARLRCVDRACESYLHAAMSTQTFERHLLAGQTGTQLPHVSGGSIGAFVLPIPPIAEQQRICDEVDRRLSIAGEVGAEVDADLERARRLREAILTKSFLGEEVDDQTNALLLRSSSQARGNRR